MRYSKQIPGEWGNYRWPVSFDFDRGYLGINLHKEDSGTERVLLSPKQIKALIAFLTAGKKSKKRTKCAG